MRNTYLYDGRALNKHVHQRVVSDERHDEQDEVGRVEQLALDDHGHDARVLTRTRVTAHHARELVSVVYESADDQNGCENVQCEREAPEAQGQVHCPEDRSRLRG